MKSRVDFASAVVYAGWNLKWPSVSGKAIEKQKKKRWSHAQSE
jgi:hypothetical protein